MARYIITPDDVATQFPGALEAMGHEGYESYVDMWECTDIYFYTLRDELYFESRGRRSVGVWRAGKWENVDYDKRPV